MTYGERNVRKTISRVLAEHPDLDPSADGALDNVDQFHLGGADAVGLLIGGLSLAEGDRVLDIGSDSAGPRGRSRAAPAAATAPSRSGEGPSPGTPDDSRPPSASVQAACHRPAARAEFDAEVTYLDTAKPHLRAAIREVVQFDGSIMRNPGSSQFVVFGEQPGAGRADARNAPGRPTSSLTGMSLGSNRSAVRAAYLASEGLSMVSPAAPVRTTGYVVTGSCWQRHLDGPRSRRASPPG